MLRANDLRPLLASSYSHPPCPAGTNRRRQFRRRHTITTSQSGDGMRSMPATNMQTYDMIMVLVLVGATVFGFWKGMAWQIASLASLVVSYFAALRFSDQLAPVFGQQAPLNKFAAMAGDLCRHVVLHLDAVPIRIESDRQGPPRIVRQAAWRHDRFCQGRAAVRGDHVLRRRVCAAAAGASNRQLAIRSIHRRAAGQSGYGFPTRDPSSHRTLSQ